MDKILRNNNLRLIFLGWTGALAEEMSEKMGNNTVDAHAR